MKKRLNIITAVVLMALTGLVTYVITYYGVHNRFNDQLEKYSRQRQELAAFFEALERIDESFIGSIDRKSQVENAVAGLVSSLGDTWSHYFTPEEYQQYLEQSSNTYVGIGITAEDSGEGGIRVKEVKSDSPAEGAGLLAGDIITHVDGAAVAEIGYDSAVGMVRGKEYTSVTLTVMRLSEDGGIFSVDITRMPQSVEAVTIQRFGSIGYVRVINFDGNVGHDFTEAVGTLLEAGVEGLVFDVRDNPGGSLSELVTMLDYLLPEGNLITLKYKDGRVVPHNSEPEKVDLPMTVLINGNSISAAEFFAACLQEYEWATLVGEKTTGKGYAQEHFRLTDGSGLFISTSEFFTPEGKSLAGVGLTPDVEVVLSESERVNAGDPSTDRQLEQALRLLGWTA